MKSYFFKAGCARQIDFFVKEKSHGKMLNFPATVMLTIHPKQGPILFDTGYSLDFKKATKYFPEKFYALAVPMQVTPEDCIASQIRNLGLNAYDIRHIVVSHFHGDHVGGLRDFPNAKFHFLKSGLDLFLSKSRIGQVRAGFLKALIPDDFYERANFLNEEQFVDDPTWGRVIDLFGDSSIFLKDISGHCHGQLGFLAPNAEFTERNVKQATFVIADACWNQDALGEHYKLPFLTKLLQENPSQYLSTLMQIRDLMKAQPHLSVIPCHCEESLVQQKAQLMAQF